MTRQPRPWQESLSSAHWRAILDEVQSARPRARGDAGRAASSHGAGSFHECGGHWPEEALSCRAASDDRYWCEITDWFATGRVFAAPVIGSNKGGLLVRVLDGIGFVPASQLADLPSGLGTSGAVAELDAMVGQDLTVRVIELDRSRNRVVCSQRAVDWTDPAIERRLRELERRIGGEVGGTVRSVCDFGAFVDVGGLDGLVHVSELSWHRVGHPSDLLSPGDRVRVVVVKVERDRRRVSLSLKRTFADPWALVARRYRAGDCIEVKITSIVPFGVFAEVAEGVEGLIHVSELVDGRVDDPRGVVGIGQVVRVRVLHVDATTRRLGLSLRQASSA